MEARRKVLGSESNGFNAPIPESSRDGKPGPLPDEAAEVAASHTATRSRIPLLLHSELVGLAETAAMPRIPPPPPLAFPWPAFVRAISVFAVVVLVAVAGLIHFSHRLRIPARTTRLNPRLKTELEQRVWNLRKQPRNQKLLMTERTGVLFLSLEKVPIQNCFCRIKTGGGGGN